MYFKFVAVAWYCLIYSEKNDPPTALFPRAQQPHIWIEMAFFELCAVFSLHKITIVVSACWAFLQFIFLLSKCKCKQQTTTYSTCGNANIASSHPRDSHLRAEERAWFQIETALNVFIKYKHVRTIILQTTARCSCNETQRATDFSISPLTTCAQVGRDRGKNCSIFMCESCAGGWKSAAKCPCLLVLCAPIHGTP